jgi:hypothetical protein
MATTKSFSFTDTQIEIIKSALFTRNQCINDLVEIFSKNGDDEGSKFMIEQYDIERSEIDVLISNIILH